MKETIYTCNLCKSNQKENNLVAYRITHQNRIELLPSPEDIRMGENHLCKPCIQRIKTTSI